MAVKIESIKGHWDARGLVFEPVKRDQLAYQQNMHVVVSAPGAVRGNHYHLQGTEIIAITGPSLVRIKENDQIRDVKIHENEIFAFTFPPGISHAIQNTGKEAHVMAAFNTLTHDPNHPDTVEDILI
ncbi:MAG: WxcM-like domain-containing protein [Deltaproteobacteria bacterium]|nr:WxcM-like domain-containing protein [Deltaproteobacteria bacterium]